MKYFNEKDNQDIIDLVKKIQSWVGLSTCKVKYRFDVAFYHNSYNSNDCVILLYHRPIRTRKTKLIDIEYGMDKYFELMEIPKDKIEYAYFIFNTLHELGHLNHTKLFNYDTKIYNIQNSVRLMIDGMKTGLTNGTLYNNSYLELGADKFAYQWFPIIWNYMGNDMPDSFIINV